jgi:hypothetical protein
MTLSLVVSFFFIFNYANIRCFSQTSKYLLLNIFKTKKQIYEKSYEVDRI